MSEVVKKENTFSKQTIEKKENHSTTFLIVHMHRKILSTKVSRIHQTIRVIECEGDLFFALSRKLHSKTNICNLTLAASSSIKFSGKLHFSYPLK
jgi:hypothetical protein